MNIVEDKVNYTDMLLCARNLLADLYGDGCAQKNSFIQHSPIPCSGVCAMCAHKSLLEAYRH